MQCYECVGTDENCLTGLKTCPPNKIRCLVNNRQICKYSINNKKHPEQFLIFKKTISKSGSYFKSCVEYCPTPFTQTKFGQFRNTYNNYCCVTDGCNASTRASLNTFLIASSFMYYSIFKLFYSIL